MYLPKVYLIHQGSDEKDSTPRAAKNILRGQRIGNLLRVQSHTLVRNLDNQRVRRGLERRRNVLGRVVGVAVQDSVYRGFARRHRYPRNCILIEPRALGALLRDLLNLVDAIEGRVQREADTACR